MPFLYVLMADIMVAPLALCGIWLRGSCNTKVASATQTVMQATAGVMDFTGAGLVGSLVVLVVASKSATSRYSVSWSYCMAAGVD
jgi:hypothetical protein